MSTRERAGEADSTTTKSTRLLIVNADDYGLTEKVSRAILKAHRTGIVTSTSVLSLSPAFDRSAQWLRDVPRLGTGAHLAAVGEDPPLLSAAEIPTLVDRKGRLRLSWRQFLPRAAAGRIDPDDLRREFAAQIERISSSGVTIDHFDTHQNLHLWPLVGDVVMDLGEVYGVKTIRVTRSSAHSPIGVTVRRLARRLERRCRARGWVFARASTGLDEAGNLDLPSMIKALHRLSASRAASAELATHPGEPGDPARQRYRWNYLWDEELAALTSGTVIHAVKEYGFTLGTFADLAASTQH
ncbi:MAG: ChbG/HpnK family deacetylase [Actinomycetes bacterium]